MINGPKGGPLYCRLFFGGVRFWRFQTKRLLFSSIGLFFSGYHPKGASFPWFEDGRLFPLWTWLPIRICHFNAIGKGQFHFCKKSQEPKIGFWTNRFVPESSWDFQNWSFLWAYQSLIERKIARRKVKRNFGKVLKSRLNRWNCKSEFTVKKKKKSQNLNRCHVTRELMLIEESSGSWAFEAGGIIRKSPIWPTSPRIQWKDLNKPLAVKLSSDFGRSSYLEMNYK